MQFAGGIMHAPMFSDGRRIDDLPGGSEERKILVDEFDKLIQIFVGATGRMYNDIKRLMNNESDLNADELLMEGLADKKIVINNMPPIKNGLTPLEIMNVASGIDWNEVEIKENEPPSGSNNKKSKMKKIASLLNLNPEASQEAIEGAVSELINKAGKLEKENKVLTAKVSQVETERDNLKNEIKQSKEAEIVNYVDELIKKDASKKEKRESLLNMAKSDFSTFKDLMPIESKNDRGAVIDQNIAPNGQTEPTADEKLAKEFAEMTIEKRDELKNSNYGKFKEMATAYDTHFDKIAN
jgi:hypothetical protein